MSIPFQDVADQELVSAYTPSGLRLVVVNTQRTTSGIRFTADISDQAGNIVGRMERELRQEAEKRITVHHLFRLEEPWQQKGLARQTLQRAVQFYDRIGIVEVRLTADDVGRYVWAIAGFDFASPLILADARRWLLAYAVRHRILLPTDVRALSHSWDFARLVIPGHRVEIEHQGRREVMEIGKAFLLESFPAWNGILDLRPESLSRRVYEEFVKSTR